MSLFYSPATTVAQLYEAIALKVSVVTDSIDFPDESGGDVTRELAVAYLAGADDIDVTAASLRFETNLVERDVTFTASPGGGGKGVVLTLPRPMFLRSVEISYPDPPAPPAGQTLRTLIRGTTGSVPPPLLASPSFPAPGEMYSAVMHGLNVTALGSGRRRLTCDGLLGESWLIQIARASSPTDISALAIVPTIHRVTADVVPSGIGIQMQTTEGAVTVWSNPGMLLPAAGVQEVSFLALGKRQLEALLKQPLPAGAPPTTLPLRLTFHSDCAGSLAVRGTDLQARYHVFPAGDQPAPLAIGGDWTEWPLTAPAGLRPESARADLRVRLDGRELNAGSPGPPMGAPDRGLRVTADRWVAAALAFAPLPGHAAGSVLPLAAARVFLAADEPAEVSLELRNDAGGNPGPPAAPSMPRRLEHGARGWIEFMPKKPIPVSSGNDHLWLVLRTTRGTVSWYAADPAGGASVAAERISADAGSTWAEPERPLAPAARLLAQLYHALSDPLPEPGVSLFRSGAAAALGNLFAGAARQGPREFVASGLALPSEVGAMFGSAPGSGKATLPFRLYSASVGTLTVDSAVLVYDPADVPAGLA